VVAPSYCQASEREFEKVLKRGSVLVMKSSSLELPEFLRAYTTEQDGSLYTAIDQATWRFIMRISQKFFSTYAHPIYLKGLKETGISIERIPLISEMDEKLQQFGWRAVAITGFIPPSIFLELLSLSILPIACDMRKLENIDYTPSPDIVHEAAGHAPILADKKYASYLHKFGEIARHAIFSLEDLEVNAAVLHLSEIREDPHSDEKQIEQAEQALQEASRRVTYVSEATQVSRLGWWSTEYGLLRSKDRFLIFGAGLLSSLGESYSCLAPSVQKLPLTLDCTQFSFDITKPQPQLFYCDDFSHLEDIIERLAATMAFRVGGPKSLEKALQARTVSTIILDTGLSISGVLAEYRASPAVSEDLEWIRFSGPVQLGLNGRQLPGHGPKYHSQGYSSPLGPIAGDEYSLSSMSESEMDKRGWSLGEKVHLCFVSGIEVQGTLVQRYFEKGQCLLMSFESCRVQRGEEVLFDPSWGTFDMALGRQAKSVHGGATDRESYQRELETSPPAVRPQKKNLTPDKVALNELYKQLRQWREEWALDGTRYSGLDLAKLYRSLLAESPQDWLLVIEILELVLTYEPQSKMVPTLKSHLNRIKGTSQRLEILIERGLEILPLSPTRLKTSLFL
jgi:phenylalanine-4-hydroxylase